MLPLHTAQLYWTHPPPLVTVICSIVPGQLAQQPSNILQLFLTAIACVDAASIKIMHEPQPTPILVETLSGVTVTKVACGQNHTIAIDNQGAAWTWGNGNYGKLGHKVQQDEHKPRLIEAFKGRMSVPADAVVRAG